MKKGMKVEERKECLDKFKINHEKKRRKKRYEGKMDLWTERKINDFTRPGT